MRRVRTRSFALGSERGSLGSRGAFVARTLTVAGAVSLVVGVVALAVFGAPNESKRAAGAGPSDQTPPNATTPTTKGPAIPPLAPPPSLDPHIDRHGTRPLRVLVIGDSVAATLQASFANTLDRLTARGIPAAITRFWTVPGFGLSADLPGLLDWDGAQLDKVSVPPPQYYASWEQDLLSWTAEDRPDVVLVLAGAWDAIPREVGNRWLVPGSPDWRRWYIERVDAANRAFGSTGALVAWLRYPCIRNTTQSGRLDIVSAMIEQAASLRPGRVAVLPFEKAVCPGGRFVPDYVPAGADRPLPLRLDDGVHFNVFGAVNKVAPWLTDQLAALVHR